jgi:hypothetical protein
MIAFLSGVAEFATWYSMQMQGVNAVFSSYQ